MFNDPFNYMWGVVGAVLGVLYYLADKKKGGK